MKITICGSMQFDDEMTDIKGQLESHGYEVDKPNVVEGHVYADNLDANASLKRGFIDEHFRKIDTSEAIVVVNQTKNGIENYIGGNTLIEISYAYSHGLEIFLLNPVPHNVSYADEIHGMHPIVLHGDVARVNEHIAALPLVYMSTESKLKHSSLARAFRKAGLPVRVEGKKVDSGVNEQPMTMDETYDGAANRQEALLDLGVKADYFATVESGLHQVHAAHGTYGCNVVIVQPAGEKPQVGFGVDVEFPQKLLDLVPSVYPDKGVWAMEARGAKEKDPFPYITNGRLSRRDTIENAVFNVAVRLGVKDEI